MLASSFSPAQEGVTVYHVSTASYPHSKSEATLWLITYFYGILFRVSTTSGINGSFHRLSIRLFS